MSTDITRLILDDHDRFRREFAALDDAQGTEELREIWIPLAALLDLHAEAEEVVLYPQLLRRGEDAENETLDAIGDHNDIRAGVREARRHPIDTSAWWDGVRRARMANSEHMAEEEDEALADFRRNTAPSIREKLGRQFNEFKARYAQDLDVKDKDPEEYVNVTEEQISSVEDHSLGIGSLKGK